MTDTDLTPQRFIYGGKRMTVAKKLIPYWLPEDDPDGEDGRLLPKAKGTVIGGIYSIKVNGDSYVPNSVTFTGDRVDRDTALLLESHDHADGVRHAEATLERNAARTSELKELCAPLRALVGKQVGWNNRAALINYILSEITRG
jgi:hypothetical protein